mgnify:CR=1 FL=1
MGKLIIDGNEVYEIDEECMKKKETEKKQKEGSLREKSPRLSFLRGTGPFSTNFFRVNT